MPTAYEYLYTATKALMTAANAASSTTIAQAPTNYGDNFSITPGSALYQVVISPMGDYHRGTVSYPRAQVVVRIHHYVSSLSNEETFLHSTMYQVSEQLLVNSTWRAQSNVFDLDPEDSPEIGDGERVGNVISFEVTAVVLMDAA